MTKETTKTPTKAKGKASLPVDKHMQTMLKGVTEKLTVELREVLTKTLEQQISGTLAQALLEGEFYRRISKDMQAGLRKIHKEISTTAKPENTKVPKPSSKKIEDSSRTNQLFSEASNQLSEVLTQTEEAAETIMEAVERQFANQSKLSALYARISEKDKDIVSELTSLQSELDNDLNAILMALSFQDLTGQRIKLAVAALRKIESTVMELYLSTGLLMQAHEEMPVQDLDKLAEETREKVEALAQGTVQSTLQGPTKGIAQANIDDLLKQLGMD